MPRLDDLPPSAVQADIETLRQTLSDRVPSKRLDENLLIATWNIRGFASLTREWTAGDADSPKHDLRGLLAIGEIIRRFDVIAVQEVKGDLRALRDLMKWLGPNWSFLMTDSGQRAKVSAWRSSSTAVGSSYRDWPANW